MYIDNMAFYDDSDTYTDCVMDVPGSDDAD